MSVLSLWAPVLVSAVLVWLAGAVIWMLMPWHKRDYAETPHEESVRGALKGAPPGAYMIPFVLDPSTLEEPDVRQKYVDGPRAFITVLPNGVPVMGSKLIQIFIFDLVVAAFAAFFVAGVLTGEATYFDVFIPAAVAAFGAHGLAVVQESVWFGRPWVLTVKSLLDAAIYGLLTGGAFGWLA